MPAPISHTDTPTRADKSRLQALGLDLERLAVAVERAGAQAVVALERVRHPRHRQAALVDLHQVVGLENLRVDHDHRLGLVLLARAVHDRQAQRDAHLGGGQAHPRRRVHGLEHVVDQALELGIEALHRPGLLPQARVGVLQDGQEGHGGAIGEISCESSGNYLL